MSANVPVAIAEKLKSRNTVWVNDTVFRACSHPLVATHRAQNGKCCAMVDGRWVYTDQRIDGGYDAVGGINLPAVPLNVEAVAATA